MALRYWAIRGELFDPGGDSLTPISPRASATISVGAQVAAGVYTLTTSGATDIAEIDTAINNISAARANFGSVQNRLEHTISNLASYQENLTASESRIRDADMASEMVQFTKLQILTQAGTSMLSQANQAPQGVLSLLR